MYYYCPYYNSVIAKIEAQLSELTEIISTVGTESAALANIMNAQAQEIGAVVAKGSVEDILSINDKVQRSLQSVTKAEEALAQKLASAIELYNEIERTTASAACPCS
jgi:molecular chaperone GrpE (heat shock protein)